jgi:phosphodiesterase/alkaline phosphatase D-like protein
MQTRVAVASCSRLEAFPEQAVWADVLAEDPDYLFLLGDQIYMDYGIAGSEPNRSPRMLNDDDFERIMLAKYEAQWKEPNFKRLLNALKMKQGPGDPRILATWDDHDFAWDNSRGADPTCAVPPSKQQISMKLFKKFLGDPGNSPSKIYFCVDTPFARVIFLDNRSHLEAPGPNAKILGEAQWQFLEEKLYEKEAKGQPTLICGGLTLTHGIERWAIFPSEYKRLRNVIKQSGRRVMFLGGDIHETRFEKPDNSRPCYELVSSGIAVNYLGLPGSADDCHNWMMLAFDGDKMEVHLHHDTYFRKGEEIWHVDIPTWGAVRVNATRSSASTPS